MKKRIFFTLVLLGSIFLTPAWFVAILALAGALAFDSYYEILAVGLLFDLVYGLKTSFLYGVFGTILASLVFLIVSYAKKNVR